MGRALGRPFRRPQAASSDGPGSACGRAKEKRGTRHAPQYPLPHRPERTFALVVEAAGGEHHQVHVGPIRKATNPGRGVAVRDVGLNLDVRRLPCLEEGAESTVTANAPTAS